MRSHLARRTIARRALVLAGAAVLTVPFATSNAFAATSSRATLGGSTPAWATSSRAVGSPSAAATIKFNVVLPLRNAAAADKLALAVSNPTSSSYGRYLSAAQFNARFAPTNAQVKKVADFLRGAGITVTGTAQGNRWVQASGTVRQIQTAFATTLRNYTFKGHVMHAPSKALSVPSSIAGLVSGVVGVTNDGALRTPDHVVVSGGAATVDSSAGPSDALPPPSQCSAFWDQHEQTGPPAFGRTSFPTPNCGYTAAQLRGAYNVQSAVSHGNNGHGVTVAIIDAYASPTIEADANQLSTMNGEPVFAAGQYTQTTFEPFTLQDECNAPGWNVEESLDVEAVHGMAPGANIHYVGAQNCDTGIDDAVNFVIQNHVANIVSNSYGFIGEDGLGDEVATEHSLFTQAAIQGIGFYFSSGDFGDNTTVGTPHPEPDFPASDPLVTAVGGTSLAVTPSNGYLFEAQWGNFIDLTNTATSPSSYTEPLPGHFNSGAGGGVSSLFTEPIYQKGTVPNSLAKLNGSTAMRVVPDVGTVADPETGFLIVVGGGAGVIGGTSLACPVFAGVQALASQGRLFPIGFANPLLYTLGHIPSTFHDVKSPTSPLLMMTTSGRTLIVMASDTSLTATKGYDDTTGIGTPNGPGLLLFEHLIP